MMLNFILCTNGIRTHEIKRSLDNLNNINDDFQVILVCQGNFDDIEKIIKNYKYKIIYIKDKGKGLSRARNIGLKYIEFGYIFFADDDNWYTIETLNHSLFYMQKYECDIGIFQYYDPDLQKYPKDYKNSYIKNLSYLRLLKVSSIEIVIDANKVSKKDILFDENFGVGTEIPSGEENILLTSLKRKNYVISYFPSILSFHPYKSFNNTKIDKKYFKEKKNLFKRMYGNVLGTFLYLIFKLKKTLIK